jgi:hypothetical protein
MLSQFTQQHQCFSLKTPGGIRTPDSSVGCDDHCARASFFDDCFQNLNMTVPTPPGSNKPACMAEDGDMHFTKLKTSTTLMRADPTGNLPHDQLAKMFPTPPSHEHNLVRVGDQFYDFGNSFAPKWAILTKS